MRSFLGRLILAALALPALYGPSLAAGQPNQCGPTSVGTSAVAVTFPASGSTGPTFPIQYVSIGNPSATATLWVNAMPGGTAAANTAGSFAIGPLAPPLTWALPEYAPPASISIIASASSSPVTCAYQ